MPATPEQLLDHLRKHSIRFDHFQHPPVYTVAEAREHCAHIPGGHCKNLFLRTKKKANWLLVMQDDAQIELKQLAATVGAGAWSFASTERLMEFLGVIPGAVTPLALINDTGHRVNAVIERRLMDYSVLNFHPLVNTETVSIKPDDLLKFARTTGHEPLLMALPAS